jgi:hypothetical protein
MLVLLLGSCDGPCPEEPYTPTGAVVSEGDTCEEGILFFCEELTCAGDYATLTCEVDTMALEDWINTDCRDCDVEFYDQALAVTCIRP